MKGVHFYDYGVDHGGHRAGACRACIVVLIVLSCIASVFDLHPGTARAWVGETWGNETRSTMLSVASQMADGTWTTSTAFTNYMYGSQTYNFLTGVTYTGIPYTQNRNGGVQDTWTSFQKVLGAADVAYQASYYGLGNDCSGFVSICWKLGERLNTTGFYNDANGAHTYCFAMPDGIGGAYQAYLRNDLRPGDALVNSGSHIIMVKSVNASGVISYENTPPTARSRQWYWTGPESSCGLSSYLPIRRKQITGDTPTAPANPTATAASSSSIQVTWEDRSLGETYFRVYRSTDGSNFTQIAAVPANTTSYLDSGLQANTKYYYKICSLVWPDSESVSSNITYATTGRVPSEPTVTTNAATSVTQTGATLNGTVNPNGDSTYAYFQWGLTTTYGTTTTARSLGSGTSNVSVADALTGLTPNTLYHFRVVAYDTSLVNQYGSDLTFTTVAAVDYGEPKSTHTWLDFPAGTSNVQSYDVDVCIDAFPENPDPAWLYYFAIQVDFSEDGGGAHGGLQWASGGEKANWGGYDLRYAGDVQSIVLDQPWATGVWYRYHVARGTQQPDGTWAWGFWITDLSTGTSRYLGDIYSKGSSISGCLVWMETGYGVVATTPRAQVRWRNPTFTFGPLLTAGHPVAGYATYNGTCVEPHTTDQQIVSSSPREWIQLTNAPVRTTPADTYLWQDPVFTLTLHSSPLAGGSIAHAPELASYPSGTSVTLTATPATGYTFTGWSGDLTGTTNPVTITMTGNKTVTATFAPTGTSATVTVGSATVSPLGSAIIDVTATIPAGANIGAAQFTLSYDSTKLSVPASEVHIDVPTFMSAANNPSSSALVVGWTASDLMSGVPGPTVVLAHVTVHALSGLPAGTSTPIVLTVNALGDVNGTPYTVATLDGSVGVTAGVLRGDVDGSGAVTMLDALMAGRAAVGIAPLTGSAFTAADLNGDGSITMLDVLMVARIAVGIDH